MFPICKVKYKCEISVSAAHGGAVRLNMKCFVGSVAGSSEVERETGVSAGRSVRSTQDLAFRLRKVEEHPRAAN